MTLSDIKATVTQIFQRDGFELRNMAGDAVGASEGLEIYVLTRLISHMKDRRYLNTTSDRGKRIFVVSAAPSNSWKQGSSVRDVGRSPQIAARTGFQVLCHDGFLCELDVGVFDALAVDACLSAGDRISSRQVRGMVECKLWKSAFSMPTANETIGKIVRIVLGNAWGMHSFAVVCAEPPTSSAHGVLAQFACTTVALGADMATPKADALRLLDTWIRHVLDPGKPIAIVPNANDR